MDELYPPDVPQVIIMHDKNATDGEYNLYVIRSQRRYVPTAIRKLQKKGYDVERSYSIKQPNAVAHWKIIKKKYKDNIQKDSKSNWFKLSNISIEQFYTEINKIDFDRMDK